MTDKEIYEHLFNIKMKTMPLLTDEEKLALTYAIANFEEE